MNTIKKFTQGFDSQTFSGIGYLLWLNIKKQVALWVFVALALILSLLAVSGVIMEYKNYSYSSQTMTQFNVRISIIAGTLIPLMFIALFSIPSTLNAIHRTTLIKRIGSTRLTEESFTLLITIWYTLITLAIVSSLFFGMLIIARLQAPSELHLLDNILKAYIFTIFLTFLMVTMGVLLGNLPISQIFITILATVLFAISIVFGGFILPMTNSFGVWIPFWTRAFVILNPVGFSSYSMASILTGSYSTASSLISLLYMTSVSLLFFFASATAMNFNKIK